MAGRSREKLEDRLGDQAKERVMSEVLNRLCKGQTASQVVEEVNRDLGVSIKREDPYKFLRIAGELNRLKYLAPQNQTLAEEIREHHGLAEVRVVSALSVTSMTEVAIHGAQVLLSLIKQRKQRKRSDEPIRVGFGGGQLCREIVSHLSHMVSDTPLGLLPERIVFHAMIGTTLEGSIRTPTSFLDILIDDPSISIGLEFVGLPAPPLVEQSLYEALQKNPLINQAFSYAHQLDIICTSAGNWRDEHSSFRQLVNTQDSQSLFTELEDKGSVGDVLWQPLDADGIYRGRRRTKRQFRTMTLLSDLDELSQLLNKGADCLAVVGRCKQCQRPKPSILSAALNAKLFTHLVVDSQTALQVEQMKRG